MLLATKILDMLGIALRGLECLIDFISSNVFFLNNIYTLTYSLIYALVGFVPTFLKYRKEHILLYYNTINTFLKLYYTYHILTYLHLFLLWPLLNIPGSEG